MIKFTGAEKRARYNVLGTWWSRDTKVFLSAKKIALVIILYCHLQLIERGYLENTRFEIIYKTDLWVHFLHEKFCNFHRIASIFRGMIGMVL